MNPQLLPGVAPESTREGGLSSPPLLVFPARPKQMTDVLPHLCLKVILGETQPKSRHVPRE